MKVKLQHPDSTNRPIQVSPERAELLKANGWVEVEKKPTAQQSN